jgi:hypothetical protein
MNFRSVALLGAALVLAGSGCGSSDSSATATTSTTRAGSTTSTVATNAGTAKIVNTWAGQPVDLTKLPVGTSHVSTTGAAVGGLYACDKGVANGPGAFRVGPWINESAGTWNATTKVTVQGKVAWPMAKYRETLHGTSRTITSNGLPVGEVTGTFPIAATDPAYSYDRNPNSIAATAISKTLPLTPVAAAAPSCLGKGAIGVLKNGVALYAPLDERNRDAVAYETQDSCDGHPQQGSTYHYHDVPSCIRDAAKGPSTVVGYAYDGYPIVVERNSAGQLPTNQDLDQCHGRTSPIALDGKVARIYHYAMTREFPYTLGCFHGTAA